MPVRSIGPVYTLGKQRWMAIQNCKQSHRIFCKQSNLSKHLAPFRNCSRILKAIQKPHPLCPPPNASLEGVKAAKKPACSGFFAEVETGVATKKWSQATVADSNLIQPFFVAGRMDEDVGLVKKNSGETLESLPCTCIAWYCWHRRPFHMPNCPERRMPWFVHTPLRGWDLRRAQAAVPYSPPPAKRKEGDQGGGSFTGVMATRISITCSSPCQYAE